MNTRIKDIISRIETSSVNFRQIFKVVSNKYFYISLFCVITGVLMNFASQTYLHNYISAGKTLPMLSDLILDNLPVYNVSIVYDIFCLIPLALLLIYLIDKKEFERLPFLLLMGGFFYIIRGIFIVLTPFGNPPMFNGSDAFFHGFANFEIGVFPSGHAGNVFMILLLVRDHIYRILIGICLIIVIVALFLAHGHYSIDILSGLFFSYAIRSFGDKYFTMFDLSRQGAINK